MADLSTSQDVFGDLAAGAHRMDYLPRTLEAQSYYRRKAMELKSITPRRLLRMHDSDKIMSRIPNTRNVIGHMIMFEYDPKHKKTLPYYDRHPLIFIVKPLQDGFLGINFHYLPYKWRAILLNRLRQLATNKKYDETTRLRMTYDLLSSTARFAPFKPCIKRYLNKHVRSRYLWIPAYDWEIAIFLPVQRFIKESQSKVWADSLKKMRS